ACPSATCRNRRSRCGLRKQRRLLSLQSPVEIVRVGTIDVDVAEFSRFSTLESDYAVDFRRIGARASDPRLVDQDLDRPAELRFQLLGTDRRLRLHEFLFAKALHILREGTREFVRSSAIHRRILEAADAIELRFLQEFN